MKFLNRLIKSDRDYEGYSSLVIHSIEGCNLKCYGCHNYKELIETEHIHYYTEEDILQRIELNGFMFDALIFSGGEFLIAPLEDITQFLKKVRDIYKGIIIINTNGTFPHKVRALIDLQLVDGFHMDVKYKFWESDVNRELAVGVKNNYGALINNSFRYIRDSNLKHSLFRTVKYPYLKQQEIEEIRIFIEKNNVVWSLNEFVIQ